jgi:hypothetical protein
MLFKKGKKLYTVSPNQDMMGIASIEEEIPQQFGLHPVWMTPA